VESPAGGLADYSVGVNNNRTDASVAQRESDRESVEAPFAHNCRSFGSGCQDLDWEIFSDIFNWATLRFC
jgi:hypothetical protein